MTYVIGSGPAVPAARALDYIRSTPKPLAGPDLQPLVTRVAQIVKIGTWRGNGQPRYNRSGDKAFVNFEFHSGIDALTYTVTFHKIDNLWTPRAV